MNVQLIQDKATRAQRAICLAQETFDIEAAAVLGLKRRVGDAFAQAVEMVLNVRGRVVAQSRRRARDERSRA